MVETLLSSQVAPKRSVTSWHGLSADGNCMLSFYHRGPYSFCLISWVRSLWPRSEGSAWSNVAQGRLLWERSPWRRHWSLSDSVEKRGVCKHTSVCMAVCGCGNAGGGEAVKGWGQDSALFSLFVIWQWYNSWLCFSFWLSGRDLTGYA